MKLRFSSVSVCVCGGGGGGVNRYNILFIHTFLQYLIQFNSYIQVY